MAYLLVKTEVGYLPLNITGDGAIIASVEYHIDLYKWFGSLRDEFERRGKIKESRLFAKLESILDETQYVLTKRALIESGFSVEFANAWEVGEDSRQHFLSLAGAENVAGKTETISEEEFERNMAIMFESNEVKYRK